MHVSEPKVGAVILSWNSRDFIAGCLDSLRAHEPDVVQYVVDNGSTDGSATFLRTRFDTISLIESPSNLGFAGGTNLGIRRALAEGCDYVLLLNNDTVIDEPFVGQCLAQCRADSTIGIIGPAIVDLNRPDVVQCLGGDINLWTLTFRYRGAGQAYVRRERVTDVGYVLGAVMIISRQVLEQVGALDPDYFPAYVEEADLCYRARANGFRSVMYENCRVRHLGAVSSGGSATSHRRFAANAFRFGLKHLRPVQFAVATHLIIWRACYRKIVPHGAR
jgi:GT2 family glycosyltransferase